MFQQHVLMFLGDGYASKEEKVYRVSGATKPIWLPKILGTLSGSTVRGMKIWHLLAEIWQPTMLVVVLLENIHDLIRCSHSQYCWAHRENYSAWQSSTCSILQTRPNAQFERQSGNYENLDASKIVTLNTNWQVFSSLAVTKCMGT